MPDPAEAFSESKDNPGEETSASLEQLSSMPSDMAEKVSVEAVSQDPRNPEKHFKLADIFRRRNNLDKAEEEYKAAIRLDARNDAYHWSLGQLYEYDRKNLVLAEAAYRDAARLAPQNQDSSFCLARVYEKQGKLALAEGIYSQLAELDPAYREAFARVCEKQGKTNVAGEEYAKLTKHSVTALSFLAENRNTVIVVAVIVVALLFVLMFIFEEKEKARLHTDMETLRKQLTSVEDTGKVKKQQRDIEDLQSKIDVLVKQKADLQPANEAVKHLAAAAQSLSKDNLKGAISALEAYLKTDPDNPVICDALGDFYRATHNITMAKKYYTIAARKGYDEASDALEFIDLKGKPPAPTPPAPAPTPPAPAPTPRVPPPPTPRPVARKADLDAVIDAYEKTMFQDKTGVRSYEVGASLAASKADILNFTTGLSEYQDKEGFADSGAFISGLIGNLPEKDTIALDLNKLKRKLHYVGMHLRDRHLTIRGNVSLFLGRGMESGTITLHGNAGGSVGHSMRGGEIIIKGNARDSVGYFMRSGKITVEGNAGKKVGDCMEDGEITIKGNATDDVGSKMSGGTIHLEGGYRSLARNMKGGRIYQRGKKISTTRSR